MARNQQIISHTARSYQQIIENKPAGKYNGAYYYSCEIVRNIIPNVKTDRSWITINVPGTATDHAIVFIHNNITPEVYNFLRLYNDLVLVCGIPETCERVKHLGVPIYLPLSIDTADVERFSVPHSQKDREAAFAGRRKKRIEAQLPEGIDFLEGIPRHRLLAEMAHYKKIYAVGRTAIEAKALGCKVMPYDPRFPDPDRWEVIDNLTAAGILQEELDKIDGGISAGVPKTRGTKTGGAFSEGVSKTRGTKNRGGSFEGPPSGGGTLPGEEHMAGKTNKEWEKGFPEKNGIYKCRIDGEEIVPLAHKICSINGRHRWMRLDGHDARGSIEFINRRIEIEEL